MSEDFKSNSFLFGNNAVFIEELYQKYLSDPSSIDQSWAEFFQRQNSSDPVKTTSKIILSQSENQTSQDNKVNNKLGQESDSLLASALENKLKAKFMIEAYRHRGHYLAKLDPLNLEKKKTYEDLHLNIVDFGFSEDNLDISIDISGEFADVKKCSVKELKQLLDHTYCNTIGAEFEHVENIAEKNWLYNHFENANTHVILSKEEKKELLSDLVEIEGFEQFLHVKFPGAKRFSIEGGEASILSLDYIIEKLADANVEQVVLGLAHRGRLSTLTKVMKKPYCAMFSEFMGSSAFPDDLDISGDVKYHMGYSSDRVSKNNKKIHLSLTPNPSHLEAVNPVVAGKVRAKQDLINIERDKVIGILIHGDAAFCGQGIVAESMVMSGLDAYNIGGIIHLVINNQIGFTANSFDCRPGRYCTEVAKMVGAPVLHVNGDDIDAVIIATKIACDYRMKFKKDIILDIVCYRKYGHNEGDEPMYTQALMYDVIKAKKTPAALYAKKLLEKGLVDEQYYAKLKEEFKKRLDEEFLKVEDYVPVAQWMDGNWHGFERSNQNDLGTGVEKNILKKLCKKLCSIPSSFSINKKLEKLFNARLNNVEKDLPIDWATAEQLAFASLLAEGIPIRMTGQDVERGTFSHRHAVLHSQTNRKIYMPLNNLSNDQANIEIADSNLSEYGVLGFEYGYSLVSPKHLVIWEAQFGDFSNGAQIIFDQFISSAETKWLRMSGIVCLLPHGYEGQGPEHSSARLERYLQLCAENNIQVVYPTTPASIFHILRRQVLRNFRKPLIVMSPKSILRHKLAVSNLNEISKDTYFSEIIDEVDNSISTKKVKKVILCSGKAYYDLFENREKKQRKDIAIIRIEQLYPLNQELLKNIIKKYKYAKDYIWYQEEPKNMGAWKYMRPLLESCLIDCKVKQQIRFVGRVESASTAAGYLYIHNKQQETILDIAIND